MIAGILATWPFTPLTQAQVALLAAIAQSENMGIGITSGSAVSTVIFQGSIRTSLRDGFSRDTVTSDLTNLFQRGLIVANGNNGSLRIVNFKRQPIFGVA